MMKYAAILMWLVGLCPALWAEPLQFVDEWSAGGQTVYGQTRAALSTAVPTGLRVRLPQTGATVRYGTLTFLDKGGAKMSVALALVDAPQGPPALYVDGDADRVLTSVERAALARASQRPPSFGKPTDPVWLARLYRPSQRLLALRTGSIGGVVACAVRGYWHGEVPSGGRNRPLAVVDADGDLWLKQNVDYAYLDVNGDEKLQSEERFYGLDRITTGNRAIRIATGWGSGASWSPAPEGEAPVRFRLGKVERTPRAITATVSSDSRQMYKVNSLDEPTTLPVGSYSIDSLMAKVEAPDGSLRSYTFQGLGTKAFEVVPNQPLTVDLLGRISIGITCAGPATPGGTLALDVTATTATHLRMTACTTGELGTAQQQGLMPPQIEFLSPSGEVIDQGPMEFG
ncbi:MAG: hypothetical protein ABFE07_02725 [Armatimonadia bacterium]